MNIDWLATFFSVPLLVGLVNVGAVVVNGQWQMFGFINNENTSFGWWCCCCCWCSFLFSLKHLNEWFVVVCLCVFGINTTNHPNDNLQIWRWITPCSQWDREKSYWQVNNGVWWWYYLCCCCCCNVKPPKGIKQVI